MLRKRWGLTSYHTSCCPVNGKKKNVRSPLYKSTHDKRKSRREQEERIKDATELYNKKKKKKKKKKLILSEVRVSWEGVHITYVCTRYSATLEANTTKNKPVHSSAFFECLAAGGVQTSTWSVHSLRRCSQSVKLQSFLPTYPLSSVFFSPFFFAQMLSSFVFSFLTCFIKKYP